MRLASGTTYDRPWGLTLGAIGLRKLSAQLTLQADDGKCYAVAFDDGLVVAASSPLISDAITRIALTAHLVSPGQVGEVTRRLAANPDGDEVEIVAAAAHLGPAHVAKLRRRVTLVRAARTFSIERGEFEITDEVTLPLRPSCAIPFATVVFQGARMNLSEQRLADDLRRLGTRYQLREISDAIVASFGFSEPELRVVDALQDGATLAELEAAHRELDPRTLHTIVYALVTCGACEASGRTPSTADEPADGGARPPDTASRVTMATPLPTIVERVRGEAAAEPVARIAVGTLRGNAAVTRPLGDHRAAEAAGSGLHSHRAPEASPRTFTEQQRAEHELASLIAERVAMIERTADHFEMLGVAREAPPDAVRAAYFQIAHQLHPDALVELGLRDEAVAAERVLAQVHAAFHALGDPLRRREYVAALKRGDATPMSPRARAGELDPAALAAEAYQRGEAALRSEQIGGAITALGRAVALVPSSVEYVALLAWAQFCAAIDKQGIAADTRRALIRAIDRSSHPMMWLFYLGRVERILGRHREALARFQAVLEIHPGHAEAAAEVRFVENRIANGSSENKPGRFGRKR